MMSKSTYVYMILTVMCAIFACCCVTEEPVYPIEPQTVRKVEIAVSTKAVTDADLAERLTVKDIWIFQFNGTSDESKLVGSPIYQDFSSDPVEEGDDTRLVSHIDHLSFLLLHQSRV